MSKDIVQPIDFGDMNIILDSTLHDLMARKCDPQHANAVSKMVKSKINLEALSVSYQTRRGEKPFSAFLNDAPSELPELPSAAKQLAKR
jgi:hypothetical protein